MGIEETVTFSSDARVLRRELAELDKEISEFKAKASRKFDSSRELLKKSPMMVSESSKRGIKLEDAREEYRLKKEVLRDMIRENRDAREVAKERLRISREINRNNEAVNRRIYTTSRNVGIAATGMIFGGGAAAGGAVFDTMTGSFKLMANSASQFMIPAITRASMFMQNMAEIMDNLGKSNPGLKNMISTGAELAVAFGSVATVTHFGGKALNALKGPAAAATGEAIAAGAAAGLATKTAVKSGFKAFVTRLGWIGLAAGAAWEIFDQIARKNEGKTDAEGNPQDKFLMGNMFNNRSFSMLEKADVAAQATGNWSPLEAANLQGQMDRAAEMQLKAAEMQLAASERENNPNKLLPYSGEGMIDWVNRKFNSGMSHFSFAPR